ncbi:MAG: hypothetical protein ONB44_02720, partial [candidate division KSB1 bacterium]|nr:hypothetical protein [candidate division KSB1 bacterium]MDZ7301038.1 hypothetical protein [candidate division KSB1 bacterium]
MTRFSIFAALLVVVLVGIVQGTALAQTSGDTLYIPGAQSLQISNIINADTLVTYRVYVLDRGAIYYIDRAFEINRSCKFIAKGDPTRRPPVLAPAIRADGSSEEWFFKFIKAGIKVELNDLYLLSMRSDGKTLGWSRAIHIGANRVSLKLRRVVFDAWTEAAIRVDGAQFVKLDVQDCHFRNLIHSTAYFGGQPFLSGYPNHPDTTKFINNTFFACNSYIFSIRGYDPYSVFEHNTIVYGAVNPFLTRQAMNLIVKNNLFYAAHAWGGDPEQLWGGWFLNFPDSVSSALIPIRIQGIYQGYATTGPEAHIDPANGIDSSLVAPSKRRIIVQNNAYHFPAELVQFYNTWNDTVTVKDSVDTFSGARVHVLRKLSLARWMNDLGLWSLQQMTNPSSAYYSPFISVTNNSDADPNFSDANVKNHLTELIAYVRKIAQRKLDNPWHYQLNFPPKWPIPENLAYTNAALLQGGTDGFPVGDLNWFPDKKAQWEKGFTIIVDGNKDPFYETLTGPNDGYLQLKYYTGNDNGNPYNNADLSAKVWTAWDKDWFYLYEEVMDDTLAANHPSNVWEED